MDHVRIRLLPQLVEGVSRLLQKKFRYFNDNISSKPFLLSAPVSLVIFYLKLKVALLSLAAKKLTIAPLAKAGSSL